MDFGDDTVIDSIIAIPDDLLAKNDLEMEMSNMLPRNSIQPFFYCNFTYLLRLIL